MPQSEAMLELRMGDTLVFQPQENKEWRCILPRLKEFDNLSDGAGTLHPLIYEIGPLPVDMLFAMPGTFFYGLFPKGEKGKTISSVAPILSADTIWQVVVRQDDSYIGYLTELLGLPFVIPPKYLPGYGHQTDLRLGADCAALAIYGQRRMGRHRPYHGPKSVWQNTKIIQIPRPGSILHFGFQVSIFYEDRGKIGSVDEEDLLLHAFENCVQIQRFGDTRLWGMPYELRNWE